MAELSYICLYGSYETGLSALSDVAMGRLMKGMLAFLNRGEEPRLHGLERAVWPMIRDQILRDQESYQTKCEALRKNGAKGGRPPKKQEESPEPEEKPDGFQQEPNKPKEKEKETEKETEKEKEKKNSLTERGGQFVKPELSQVRAYCQEMGYQLDCEEFIDFYASKGWLVGNAPMQDWQAALRNWAKNGRRNSYGKSNGPAPGTLAAAAARFGPIGVEL